MVSAMESWHQRNARKRDYENRKVPACIVDEKRYGFWSLCGSSVPRITVDIEHAHKKHNNTCKKCKKIAGIE